MIEQEIKRILELTENRVNSDQNRKSYIYSLFFNVLQIMKDKINIRD